MEFNLLLLLIHLLIKICANFVFNLLIINFVARDIYTFIFKEDDHRLIDKAFELLNLLHGIFCFLKVDDVAIVDTHGHEVKGRLLFLFKHLFQFFSIFMLFFSTELGNFLLHFEVFQGTFFLFLHLLEVFLRLLRLLVFTVMLLDLEVLMDATSHPPIFLKNFVLLDQVAVELFQVGHDIEYRWLVERL